jgi:hypothetical protein
MLASSDHLDFFPLFFIPFAIADLGKVSLGRVSDAFQAYQELLLVHVAGKNLFENCGHRSLSPFCVCIQEFST